VSLNPQPPHGRVTATHTPPCRARDRDADHELLVLPHLSDRPDHASREPGNRTRARLPAAARTGRSALVKLEPPA
jgi:hypothetical protein